MSATNEATPRARVPIKAGYFRVPEDPAAPPEILGTRCRSCGEHFFPRRRVCAQCLSRDTEDTILSPHGTLYSYTFVHFPLFGSTNLEHMGGYGVGQIDLAEGPRVQVPIAGRQEDFRIGQKLVAELEKLRENELGQDVMIIRFRPVEIVR
ncbi:MAG: Zn-ribbon domain-containing OB-fold protein [Candidatus Binatia bacterium]